MKLHRSVAVPIRREASWDERWRSFDMGLIACWERGRQKRAEDPALAAQANNGRLVVLPWKGGIERAIKKELNYGTLFYLAMWQGLRGEDLDIDVSSETALTCSQTGVRVIFTSDRHKYQSM